MIKITIVEDEFFAAEHLKGLFEGLGYSVVGVHHSGEDFLRETNWDFDIAFVDVFLSEEMTGLDVAKHIGDRQLPFIFLTANRDGETLTKAARLNPRAYISKPFNVNDVKGALEIFAIQHAVSIEVKGAHGREEVNPNDILYIKSDGAYIEIITRKKKYLERKLLKEIELELPRNFARTHRSFIVNKDYIDQRGASELKVGDYLIPVSRNYKGFS